MTSKEKSKYRSTSKWKNWRKYILQKRKNTCEICGIVKTKGLQVHHQVESDYKDLKEENFSLLCSSCHKEIERLLSRTKNKIDIDDYCDKLKKVFLRSGR